jgi:hypothetical protein
VTQPDAPRYLVASPAAATAVLRALARTGWTTREGFALPESAWDVAAARLALYGRVTDADTAELVLLAAVRGAAVVAIADLTAELGRALLADLSRIGPVHTGPPPAAGGPTSAGAGAGTGGRPATGNAAEAFSAGVPASAPGPAHRLAAEHRALLDRLASGETIAAAATAEFLSLRTANRRIAQAREILGVRTTREAVLAYLKSRREQP